MTRKASLTINGHKVVFAHTAVNKDMHLWINDYHNPKVCPECIQRGILAPSQGKGYIKR